MPSIKVPPRATVTVERRSLGITMTLYNTTMGHSGQAPSSFSRRSDAPYYTRRVHVCCECCQRVTLKILNALKSRTTFRFRVLGLTDPLPRKPNAPTDTSSGNRPGNRYAVTRTVTVTPTPVTAHCKASNNSDIPLTVPPRPKKEASYVTCAQSRPQAHACVPTRQHADARRGTEARSNGSSVLVACMIVSAGAHPVPVPYPLPGFVIVISKILEMNNVVAVARLLRRLCTCTTRKRCVGRPCRYPSPLRYRAGLAESVDT